MESLVKKPDSSLGDVTENVKLNTDNLCILFKIFKYRGQMEILEKY